LKIIFKMSIFLFSWYKSTVRLSSIIEDKITYLEVWRTVPTWQKGREKNSTFDVQYFRINGIIAPKTLWYKRVAEKTNISYSSIHSMSSDWLVLLHQGIKWPSSERSGAVLVYPYVLGGSHWLIDLHHSSLMSDPHSFSSDSLLIKKSQCFISIWVSVSISFSYSAWYIFHIWK